MSRHPGEEELLRFRQSGSTSGEVALREHLDACGQCREILLAADRFDDGIRQGLRRVAAPDRLLVRIQKGLDDAPVNSTGTLAPLWGRLALGTAAALLLVTFGWTSLWLWSETAAPGEPLADGLRVATEQVLRGQLVCFGCARQGADMEHQQLCRGDGDLHVTGMQTPDGNTWRFMEGEVIHPFLGDPLLRGQWVEVSANPYPAIGYLKIAAARRL